MGISQRLLALIPFIAITAFADSSSGGVPIGERTYPGDVPEGCDVVDATVSLEKWVSYDGPFIDFDVPLDITCLTSKVFHPLIRVEVNLMCGDGSRSIVWRFQGGGTSGEPIHELGNEIPPGKTVTPIKMHGFPKTISGHDFNEFLDVYNNKIRGGNLGDYSWNPDNYKCSNELNCGGYFLITLQAMMGNYIVESSIGELADELKKGLKDCEHFAFELAGNAKQYDDAIDLGPAPGSEQSVCDDEQFTSNKDKNCYPGPDGNCYEDPGTTYCNGMTQSMNEYLPCYIAPDATPTVDPEPTPQTCLGGCDIEPTPMPDVSPTPLHCSGARCGEDLGGIPAVEITPTPQTCAGSRCTVDPTPTPEQIEPTPVPCIGSTRSSGNMPCTVPTISVSITPQPAEIICSGAVSTSGACSVPQIERGPNATATPTWCNGTTQSRNPKAPCYLAPASS